MQSARLARCTLIRVSVSGCGDIPGIVGCKLLGNLWEKVMGERREEMADEIWYYVTDGEKGGHWARAT